MCKDSKKSEMSYQLSVTLLLRSEGTMYLQRKRMGFILLCSRLSVPLPRIIKSEEKKMDYLPKDPAILVSSVNMLLRDEEFDTLESLCYAWIRGVFSPFCGGSLGANSLFLNFFLPCIALVDRCGTARQRKKSKKNFGSLENGCIFAPAFDRGAALEERPAPKATGP